jgi:hypothetical protein
VKSGHGMSQTGLCKISMYFWMYGSLGTGDRQLESQDNCVKVKIIWYNVLDKVLDLILDWKAWRCKRICSFTD